MATWANIPTPLVNGHRYSFASIELQINDLWYVGFTSVSYSEEVAPVEIYGSDSIRIGRTVGKRKTQGEIEMYRREWDVLRSTLGTSFGRKKAKVIVHYADLNQPTVTDRIDGYLSKVDAKNDEGTDPTTITLGIDAMDIRWGGTGGVGAPDGTALEQDAGGGVDGFWLANADGIEGPVTAPNPWDNVWLAGICMPGLCSVKGLPTLAFDKKKGAGVDGATITVNGYLPGPVDIECKMWTPGQWELFQHMAETIWTKPNKGKIATDDLARSISHPGLTLWGISQVIVLGVSVIESVGEQGAVRVARLKCQEYVPTKAVKKTVTAKGSKPGIPSAAPLVPRNQIGDAPSKTSINPAGDAKTRKGGVS